MGPDRSPATAGKRAAMFDYQDTLAPLNQALPLPEKLHHLRTRLRENCDCVDRIAVAIYDDKTDLLKTFVDSSGGDEPLKHYQHRLQDTPMLKEIVERQRPRVVNDLSIFSTSSKPHAQAIDRQGYAASYTMPMNLNGVFFGFVFFNSYRRNAFSVEALHNLDLFGHLISLLIINEVSNIRTLLAAVKTAREISYHRDNETGAHLNRMAYYSRLIAHELAQQGVISDEQVEHIFLFSPLHDIGKIGVPDNILLKPAKLSEQEFEVMKRHAETGRRIIDTMLDEFSLNTLQHIEILRNIVEMHHEALNGSGYPHGLKGDDIPIEACIIAVADVFDALTSRRPYKEAWDNDRAFDNLRQLSGLTLDPRCVQALIDNRAEVERIQANFSEDTLG